MTQQHIRKLLYLEQPTQKVEIVLDTDTYNEIDDHYAIAYALRASEKLNVSAIYAAPFHAQPFFPPLSGGYRSKDPGDGMEKSYHEIHRLIDLMEEPNKVVLKGSDRFLRSETESVSSDAATDLVNRSLAMPSDQKLYVVCIAALTNIASALLLEPKIKDKIVIVWLGGHASYWLDNREFNCMQDVAAARVVFGSGAPLIQIPCFGVTSHLITTEPELREQLKGKNPLCDYLYQKTCEWALEHKKSGCWSKPLWDVAAVAWLTGASEWMVEYLLPSPIITYDFKYGIDNTRHYIGQVQHVYRDAILTDLFNKLVL